MTWKFPPWWPLRKKQKLLKKSILLPNLQASTRTCSKPLKKSTQVRSAKSSWRRKPTRLGSTMRISLKLVARKRGWQNWRSWNKQEKFRMMPTWTTTSGKWKTTSTCTTKTASLLPSKLIYGVCQHPCLRLATTVEKWQRRRWLSTRRRCGSGTCACVYLLVDCSSWLPFRSIPKAFTIPNTSARIAARL